MQAGKLYQSNQNSMTCFMGLLQGGLNRMEEDSMLGFIPDRQLYKKYIEKVMGITYISNPYGEEKTKIMGWVDRHPDDIRGLAVGLWFTGEISAAQIASLKKEDCGRGILKKEERAKYISMALKLQPKNGSYVFMAERKGGWEKLMARSLQTKLYYICDDLGIEYRRIHKDEAFICRK